MAFGEAVRAVVQRNGRIVLDSVISTVRTTGMIFLILMAAFTLSYAFARLGISQDIADVIVGWNLTDWQLVLALVVFYLVLGTFMESFAMMVTTVPILLPTLSQAGVDLVWFGVIIVLLVEAALSARPRASICTSCMGCVRTWTVKKRRGRTPRCGKAPFRTYG